MKAFHAIVFTLFAVSSFSSFVKAVDNNAALQTALNMCYKHTQCTRDILKESITDPKSETIPNSCGAKCFIICVLKLARLGDDKNGMNKEKVIDFIKMTNKDNQALQDDIIKFLNLCFDPSKETADRLVEKCKNDPNTKDPQAECDDKWGCFHSWGVVWCAVEHDGVSIMSGHAESIKNRKITEK